MTNRLDEALTVFRLVIRVCVCVMNDIKIYLFVYLYTYMLILLILGCYRQDIVVEEVIRLFK